MGEEGEGEEKGRPLQLSVLRSTFYIAESSFAFCEELAHKKGKFSSARTSSIACYPALLVIK